MRTSIVLATLAALISVFSTLQPVAAQTGTKTVVVDVNYIFKHHPNFERQMEQMKTDVEAFDQELRTSRQQLVNLQTQLQDFNPGTPQYQQIEQQTARLTADTQVRTQVKRNEFLTREARIYFDTYQEIATIIKQYSEQQGITLVIRFSSEEIDVNDRDAVLRGVNRAVVYQQNLNITYNILDLINQRYAQASGAGNQPAPR